MHTGIVMLAVAFLLIWVGRPSKSGIHKLSCFAFDVTAGLLS